MSQKTCGVTYLLRGDGLLRGLGELFNSLGVVAQILLAANKDNGETLAEVKNLGNPLRDRVSRCRSSPLSPLMDSRSDTHLLLDVIERVRRVDGETNQNDMRVGV